MIAAYLTSQELLESDPDLVERFVEALEESLEYAQDNPDAAREIINTDGVQLLADLALEDGLVDEEVDVEALLP